MVTFPTYFNPNLVKEFYANAYQREGKQDPARVSYVRGKKIDFNAAAINKFLKTPSPIEECAYADSHVTAEELKQILCKEGAGFYKVRENTPRRLRSKDLTPVARAWHQFVNHTILACSNVSDVIIDRARLLYHYHGGRCRHWLSHS